MSPIDEFELDVLEHTGDVELAELVGDTVRRIVVETAESIAVVLGVDAPTIRADVERALLLCPSFTVDNAVEETDDDG